MSNFKSYNGNAPYIFVSYSHSDSEQVLPILGELFAEGYRIWYDEGIPPDESWRAVINAHIYRCECVLVFVTRAALSQGEVANECAYATEMQRRMCLVFLEDVPDNELAPAFLAARAGNTCLHANRVHSSLFIEQLRAPLENCLGGLGASTTSWERRPSEPFGGDVGYAATEQYDGQTAQFTAAEDFTRAEAPSERTGYTCMTDEAPQNALAPNYLGAWKAINPGRAIVFMVWYAGIYHLLSIGSWLFSMFGGRDSSISILAIIVLIFFIATRAPRRIGRVTNAIAVMIAPAALLMIKNTYLNANSLFWCGFSTLSVIGLTAFLSLASIMFFVCTILLAVRVNKAVQDTGTTINVKETCILRILIITFFILMIVISGLSSSLLSSDGYLYGINAVNMIALRVNYAISTFPILYYNLKLCRFALNLSKQ